MAKIFLRAFWQNHVIHLGQPTKTHKANHKEGGNLFANHLEDVSILHAAIIKNKGYISRIVLKQNKYN